MSSASFLNKALVSLLGHRCQPSLIFTPGSFLSNPLAPAFTSFCCPMRTVLPAQSFQHSPVALFLSSPPPSTSPFFASSLPLHPHPQASISLLPPPPPPLRLFPALAGAQHSTPDVGADQEGRGWWLLLFWDILSLSGGWSWNQRFHLNQAGGCRKAAVVTGSSSSSLSLSLFLSSSVSVPLCEHRPSMSPAFPMLVSRHRGYPLLWPSPG